MHNNSINTRFKKGQSGNPKGRPKASKNISKIIDKELEQKITITENGKRIVVSKKHAIVKQMINKSLSGDCKSLSVLLKIIHSSFSSDSDKAYPIISKDLITLENANEIYKQVIKGYVNE